MVQNIVVNRRGLNGLKQTVDKIWVLKELLVKTQKEMRSTVVKIYVIWEKTDHHKQNVCRHTNAKSSARENSEGNKEGVIGKRKKDDPCFKVAENLAKICSTKKNSKGMVNLLLVLKTLDTGLMDYLRHLNRSQEWRRDYPWNICEGPCLVVWMPVTYTGFPRGKKNKKNIYKEFVHVII